MEEIIKNELHVFSINKDEHIGAINASIDGSSAALFVVLDSSEPMRDEAARFVKEILPLVMSKVKYWGSGVEFISFGEESVHKGLSTNELSDFNFKSGGAANIGPAIEKLRLHLEARAKDAHLALDLLTFSAGEIVDHEKAKNESKKLTDYLATTNWRVNSQAVRLINASKNYQPDTKALSYLLQINNTTAANICDINVASTNEAIASELRDLFPENSFYGGISFEKEIVLRFPWKSILFGESTISAGWNIFWLKQVPTIVTISCLDGINIVKKGQLNLATFQQLMEKQLPCIVSHMKIIKIVGSAEANKSVDEIFSYFASTEDALALKSSSPNNKIITNALAGIAHYKPDFRDSGEMLEFYRNPTKVIADLKERVAQERSKRDEEKRLRREDEERLKQEVSRQKEEAHRKPFKEEQVEKKQTEREAEEHRKLEQVRRRTEEREKVEHVKRAEEVTTGPNGDPYSIQTVFILDERTSGANESRRFTEKSVPLVLSKLFSQSLQLVHRVTFVRYKTTAAEMLQSLVQTLDATMQIRISILTNGGVHLRQDIEDLAETVAESLGEFGYSFELQVVRLASTSPSKRYKFVDLDADESSAFIGKQIFESATASVKQRNVHDYVAIAAGMRNYCSLYSILFFMIFALLTLRYIYLISKV